MSGDVPRWLAAIVRPYYPDDRAFDSQEKAEAHYAELLNEHALDGDQESYVYLAQIVKSQAITTYY